MGQSYKEAEGAEGAEIGTTEQSEDKNTEGDKTDNKSKEGQKKENKNPTEKK